MAKLFANDTIGIPYQDALKAQHRGSNWGSTGARYSGYEVLSLLRDRTYITSVLDFGAGKGSMGRFIEDQGVQVAWTNYDPGMPEYDTLPTKQFDMVISTDVLEHVEPEKLPEVIKQLASYTGKVLYSDIACYPTEHLFSEGPYAGEDLHLIIEHPSWWREQFRNNGLQEFEYHHKEKRTKGKMRERCVMIHERV